MPDGPDKPGPQPGTQSSSQIIERKLATILSADVAEFSRLMNEDEEQTLRVFRGHKKIFESLVVLHHGRVFNTAGDAILAEFASAVEAVRCATDVQSALRTRNDKFPLSRQVRFRIGINLGDVMLQGQDLLGDGVNVAARLQGAAEPGGICISGSVHDQIRNKLSLAFHAMGERSYKNIPQPVRTFSIVEAEGGATLPSPKPPNTWRARASWLVTGLLVAVGVGYAAYVVHQRSRNEGTTANAVSAPPGQAPSASTLPEPTNPSAGMSATPQRPSSVPSAPSVQPKAAATGGEPALLLGAPKPIVKPPAPSPASDARQGRYDGRYSGKVCYGQTHELPARCYDAEGTIHHGKITGSWPMKNEAGVTMYLAGEITPTGDLTLLMHSDNSDGTRITTINLKGTVKGGVLEADGKFQRGRPANLHWHLSPDSSR
jgi:class 3 adenylate cyclase